MSLGEPAGPGGRARGGTRRAVGTDVYTYDSDSSAEEYEYAGGGGPDAPVTLPLPPPAPFGGGRRVLYDSHRPLDRGGAEVPVPDGVPSAVAAAAATGGGGGSGRRSGGSAVPKPPIFLDLDRASQADRAVEGRSWIVLKMPTRLPPLDPSSGTWVKAEGGGDAAAPMEVDSGALGGGGGGGGGGPPARMDEPQRYPGAPKPAARYDDVLRSAPAGRYGRIRVRRSGRAVLVIGEGTPEEVTLDLNEGIPCSFLQQAVNIDPENGTYLNMGEVHRSIVATPDLSHVM